MSPEDVLFQFPHEAVAYAAGLLALVEGAMWLRHGKRIDKLENHRDTACLGHRESDDKAFASLAQRAEQTAKLETEVAIIHTEVRDLTARVDRGFKANRETQAEFSKAHVESRTAISGEIRVLGEGIAELNGRLQGRMNGAT